MIKIGVYNHKGGTGKTTATVNISTILEHVLNKKVLVIDVDDQSDSSDRLLINNSDDDMPRLDAYLNEVFREQLAESGIEAEGLYYNITPLIRKSIILTKNGKKELNVSVVPACSPLDVYPVDPFTIRDMLAPVEDRFDYCLIDMPAELSNMTYSALTACDYVLVMARPDYDSFKHWGEFTDALQMIRNEGWNINVQTLGICVNEFENFSGIRTLMEMIGGVEQIQPLILDTKIPHSGTINTANINNVPVIHYAPKAPATKTYVKLTKEIVSKIEKHEKEKMR